MKYLILFLLTTVNALTPVCREGGKLRSDLQFKYSYKESIEDSSKDIDFSQRSGVFVKCTAAGTTGTAVPCESVATGEGPGLDRFGWATQTMVGVKGSVKFYSPGNDLTTADHDFTSGTECGSKVILPTGANWAAAVCKEAVRVYYYDGSVWSDHASLSFPGVNHDISIDINHEDYMIVRASGAVKIYRLGIVVEEVQDLIGDGLVAATVNCKGSVFAYESAGAIKIKQLSQKDLSWTDLSDIATDAVAMEMSSDVFAVSSASEVKIYMFANGGTSYEEYKILKGGNNFGKLLALKHDDLAVTDDTRTYFFHDSSSTKCRESQKLVTGACIDCGLGYSNAHDNTHATCVDVSCSTNERVSSNACVACPVDSTKTAGDLASGEDTECVCSAGMIWENSACSTVLCAENEKVESNACVACAAGTDNVAGDSATGSDTTCDTVTCGTDEHVVGNQCVACPVGSSKVAGDDSSGADTECVPDVTCAVNQFYAGGCQACPSGTEKAVAVNSMGGDSSCDPILCAENEYVSNNVCTACTGGSIRDPGDDSSGTNTECSCPADTEGDGSACQACPPLSTALPGNIASKCTKNDAAIWHDEVVNGPADAGACEVTLDCTSKVADPSTCLQPYEDGGVLQATSPCCMLTNPSTCLCPVDHRVSNNECVPCTSGETRPEGDNPDGSNTYCSVEGIAHAFGNNGNDHFTHVGVDDPDINLKVGQKYTFLRDSAGHPLRIVSEADCPSCNTGTWSTLPISSLGLVDAEQGIANVVWTPKIAGTYYYVCTVHPNMVGKIIVAWEPCSFATTGTITMSDSCEITSSLILTGDLTINMASARHLRSGDKHMLSMSDLVSPGINSGVYNININDIEVTSVTSDNQLISGSGTVTLDGVHLKDNARNTATGSLIKNSGGHIIAQNMVISNSKGQIFEGISGGDISFADSVVSGSGDVIKQTGGAVLVRSVSVSGGGKLADLNDATTIFEAVSTDGGDGISAVKSAVQIERSEFKNHVTPPIVFNSKSCTACKRALVVENTVIMDSPKINIQSDASDKPTVKIIEGNFTGITTTNGVESDNGVDLYIIDPVTSIVSSDTVLDTCLPYQCAHKPLASTCEIDAGKGTKCVCNVGVSTYNSGTMSMQKQTTVEEILAMLFATGDTADRIVKLVDKNVRYIPTSPTPESAKSNILLLKPTNADGEFASEKTILLQPVSGVVCATFQTWLCAELTACHYANGTITADCDGNKILTPSSNAARRRLFMQKYRLKAQHPADPNCNGAISNLRQQCTDSTGAFYTRCVEHAYLSDNQCVCIDGRTSSGGTECIVASSACKENERVQAKQCVACEGNTMNIAGDDSLGADTTCDDVLCREGFKADGSGGCTICGVGEFNLAGDIAKKAGVNGIATTCCAAGYYEYSVDLNAGTRVCKSCTDATEPLRTRYGTTEAGLHCCWGENLSNDDLVKCDRILNYWHKICKPLESLTQCPAQTY